MQGDGGGCPIGMGRAAMAEVRIGADPAEPPKGFRHFLGRPTRRFQWRGADPRLNDDTLDRFRRDMAVLATAMESSPEPLLEDKPSLPAGYTYALQFVAHDMVDTSPAFWTMGEQGETTNRRTRSLQLDTLYGAGPDHGLPPGALVPDPNSSGLLLAFRLDRVHPAKGIPTPDDEEVPAPAERDIPRVSTQAGIGGKPPPLNETLLADPRNDQHLLLSQTTVLFMALHNAILATLPGIDAPAPAAARAARLAFVRAATTLIYREILRKDILPRILHPRIHALYAASGPILEQGETRRDMPLEFSHGAFRFGHALVRGDYRLRNGTDAAAQPHPLARILKRNSETFGTLFPQDSSWLLDWSAFLPMAGAGTTNMARRLGATSNPNFAQDSRFGSILKSVGTQGVAVRDLLSAGLAGNWSVWSLLDAIRQHPGGGVFIPLLERAEADWKMALQGWWDRLPSGKSSDIRKGLEDDPPLPFFVLLEAGCSTGHPGLGPLGSIIVAETILGALSRDSAPGEEEADDLPSRLRRIGELYGFRTAAAGLPAIDTMAGIPRFLAAQPHWSNAVPPLFSAAPALAG